MNIKKPKNNLNHKPKRNQKMKKKNKIRVLQI